MNAAKERLAAARLTRKFAEQRSLSYSNHQYERTIYCTLSRDGLSVHFAFSPLNCKTGHLAHWVSKCRLPADFADRVNQYHGCKATTFANSVDEMLRAIDVCFAKIPHTSTPAHASAAPAP